MKERKKILIAMPTSFDLHKMVIRNLENSNYEVTSICIPEFEYQNVKDKCINFLRKFFLRDKTYKRIVLYYAYKSVALNKKLTLFSENHFDYCLFIRPDVYPIDVIKRSDYISKKSIAYQWDGLNRFPTVFDRIPLFDVFYAFDANDFINFKDRYANLRITTNFYSNFEPEVEMHTSDVYYLGTYFKERMGDIHTILEKLAPLNLTLKILLFRHKKNKLASYENKELEFFQGVVSYEENLAYIKSTNILLDFKTQEHDGLSFRFYEAIKYKVKVVTNNSEVFKYDFYNPNNIFVTGIDSYDDLPSFVDGAYHELEDDVYRKYSFDTWIINLLH